MGQEFIIKSPDLEDKINQLLPSQGGFAAGVDLSASTTIIPIVDLTESAEGSGLRQDLQQALSLTSVTSFAVNNTTTTIINHLMKSEISSSQRKGDWNITGVDPDGFDLRKKKITARFFFEKEISNAKKLRGIFVNLHKRASEIN